MTTRKPISELSDRELAGQLLSIMSDYDRKDLRAEQERRNQAMREQQNAEYQAAIAAEFPDRERLAKEMDKAHTAEAIKAEAEAQRHRDLDSQPVNLDHTREIVSEPWGVTGAEADIEANYPGGLAAYRRDARP